MNADISTIARLVGVGVAWLVLFVGTLYLDRRVVRWVRNAAPREKRRLARAILAFWLLHGFTLTSGGLAFALAILGLHDDLPTKDRADFLRCMLACFAAGPTLALACWAVLHFLHRRLAAG